MLKKTEQRNHFSRFKFKQTQGGQVTTSYILRVTLPAGYLSGNFLPERYPGGDSYSDF